ncbi:hypothetical protein BDV97DRAFT_400235 [Delphinella strobiligena]|nr:hypothetical protein BDV97DRAFT_400235 [Delphinella strobiligena]
MFAILNRLNRLLPFATPGTPIIQDLLHLAALCTVLYYAPQIQSYVQARLKKDESQHGHQATDNQQHEELPDHEFAAEEPRRVPQPRGVENDEDDLEQEVDLPEEENQPLFPGDGAQDEGAGRVDDFAGPAGPRPAPSTRTVGAKKAKSLARKDQRRAYHEFQRSQGEAQRARDAEGAAQREAQLASERARRAALEAEVEAKRAKEREEKKDRELRAQREELERRERAVLEVRREVREKGICDAAAVAKRIGGGADGPWVVGLVKASGLLRESRDGGKMVLMTESGWVVEVGREDMEAVYSSVLQGGRTDDSGRVSHTALGSVLEDAIRKRAVPAV